MKLGVSEITKQYKNPPLLAIDKVSFDVDKGDFVCIIGPSGCGKTTLLRIIAQLDTATSGKVLVDGKEVAEPGPDRAMVFQELNQLFAWKTILGNVEFPMKVNKIGNDERDRIERAKHYLRLVGIDDKFHSVYPHQVSGGMMQRVAIARALALDPEVLLMDEPFGSVDALTRSVLQKETLRIWEETEKTVLFVTHNIEEAILLGTRIIVLSCGPSRVVGDLKNAVPEPRNPSGPEFGALWTKLHGLLRA